jgi:hypothetical protein
MNQRLEPLAAGQTAAPYTMFDDDGEDEGESLDRKRPKDVRAARVDR